MVSSLSGISFPSAANYKFIDEIGRGGMGIAYLAEKHSEGVSDLVVLKTIRSMRENQVNMLKKEANVAATLRHENIVRTFGLETIPLNALPEGFRDELDCFSPREDNEGINGSEILTQIRIGLTQAIEESVAVKSLHKEKDYKGKRLYLIVMEYVEGRDLRKVHRNHIRAGLLLPITLSAFIVSRICRALEYAHEYIVHRDLSPDNILINNQGVSKLMDFGLAVTADQDAFGLAGKIQYMSPEQVLGGTVDNRSDIFALGLVAYHLLTGISLFVPPIGLSFQEQARHYELLLEEEIMPPHEVCLDIPEEYSRIIMKMLTVDPDMRYQEIEKAGNEIEKQYIYAEGFGPTNNSLAVYLKLFNSAFLDYTDWDLKHLAFLSDNGPIDNYKRSITKSLYSDTGRRLLMERRSKPRP